MKNCNLPPFKAFVLQNFPFIEEDFDALTYYEILCKLFDQLKLTDEQVAKITEIINNFDIQEEVDKKLDEMAEDGTLERLINQTLLTEKLDYYIITNTMTFNEIQSIMNIERAKILDFIDSSYSFNATFRLNKNTTLLLNKAELTFNIPNFIENWRDSHGFFNFKNTDEFSHYEGNGNIKIIGGTIIGGNCSFCHAENIEFININFVNCLNNHIIEMAGLKNVKIKGCSFEGMYAVIDNSSPEYIQTDVCNYNAFPFLPEDSNNWDGTACENILIEGNNFLKPTNVNFGFYNAFGTHSYFENSIHKNFIIRQNYFENTQNMCIQLYNINKCIIENNKFVKNIYETVSSHGAMIRFRYNAYHVIIGNNYFDGNVRAIETAAQPVRYEDFEIYNNTFINYNFSEDSYSYAIIQLTNPNNFNIHNNQFLNNKQVNIRVSHNDDYDYLENKFTYKIENNMFNTTKFENNVIQVRCGIPFIIGNSFIPEQYSSNFPIVAQYSINDIFIKNNLFADILTAQTINTNLNEFSYKNVYDILKIMWYGSASSILTSESFNFDVTQFNKLILIVGSSSNTQTIEIIPYNPREKLDDRTYIIPVAKNNGDISSITFTINQNGTFDFDSSTSGANINLRSIYGINE